MELQLKNIGMITEANVKIDGLTVIAGENDTGKSTVGKALVSTLYNYSKREKLLNINEEEKVLSYQKNIFKKLMKFSFNQNSEIILDSNNVFIRYSNQHAKIEKKASFIRAIMIETPIIMNFYEFFSRLSIAQEEVEYDITNYPYTFKFLYKRLSLPLKNIENSICHNLIKDIIDGDFQIEKDNIVFKRNDKKYDINAVATGLKSFGILQLLSKNGYLKKDNILILDEPEVHLHPKWQLEMAKVIVELVQSDVKVLVTSHSPYMIEALKRYSDKEEQEEKTNFYLAEDGYIKQIEESNSKTLEKIFEKLSEPFDVFEEMDSQSLGNLING